MDVTASGTQSGQPIGTEVTLADMPGDFTYVCVADLSAMQSTDTVVLTLYDVVLSGGARTVAYEETFVGVQSPDPEKVSIPLPSAHGARFTLTQTAGVARAIPWEVRAL